MIKLIRAFVTGVREVNSIITTNFEDDRTQDWYERGRYLAWRFIR